MLKNLIIVSITTLLINVSAFAGTIRCTAEAIGSNNKKIKIVIKTDAWENRSRSGNASISIFNSANPELNDIDSSAYYGRNPYGGSSPEIKFHFCPQNKLEAYILLTDKKTDQGYLAYLTEVYEEGDETELIQRTFFCN